MEFLDDLLLGLVRRLDGLPKLVEIVSSGMLERRLDVGEGVIQEVRHLGVDGGLLAQVLQLVQLPFLVLRHVQGGGVVFAGGGHAWYHGCSRIMVVN